MMIDWTTTAFIFPGQASQTVGMGKDFHDTYPVVREVFQQADDLLGFRLSALCFDGPEDALNETINTQPAIYTCSIAMLRALQSELVNVQPAFVAGHSLGEFSALTAVGALSFEDGLRLVRERGRLMKEAGKKHPGAMAALLGAEVETAAEVCELATSQTGRPVVVANDNSPGQIVISGDAIALDIAMSLAKDAGVKRVVKLAVSIAAHSPLMASASLLFRKALDSANFQEPSVPVYANASAQPVTSVDDIRDALGKQLTQAVRWTETVGEMIAEGAEVFVEVGPGDVLTGLLKRIDRSKRGITLNSVEALKQFVGEYAST